MPARSVSRSGETSRRPGDRGSDSSIMPNDVETPLAELRDAVRRFVAERAWEQFHTPKNLAMSIVIEAAELMEHVQWLEPKEAWRIAHDAVKKAAVAEEIADVFSYLLALCNVLDLDLTQATLAKLQKNEAKYPVDQFRGRYGEDDPRPAK
jgi:NTP pyrophosphatase (non-canonical NTP hydrolase)